jgi:predicted Zn-dependent protease
MPGAATGAARRMRSGGPSLDSGFVPAWVNLADYLRATGDETAAGAALRDGLRHSPDNASLHYALGLTLIRQRQIPGALDEFKAAARLAPGDAHMGYVYGVALHDTGNPRAGVAQLMDVLKGHPDNVEVLQALAAMHGKPAMRRRCSST